MTKEKVIQKLESEDVDFTGMDLQGLDLSNIDFKNSILKDANCENVDFSGANLTHTYTIGMKVKNANIQTAILNGGGENEKLVSDRDTSRG